MPEIFATRREEMARAVAGQISQKLAADGVLVKEIMLRDIQLPAEYAKGMEGLLLKEQENERLSVELEVKEKMVKQAELEAEAQEAREVKAAEARAQVVVLEAKAQADAIAAHAPIEGKADPAIPARGGGAESLDRHECRGAGSSQSDRQQGGTRSAS